MGKRHVELTETDRDYLTTLLSKGNLPVKVFRRATALLRLDAGSSYVELARYLSHASGANAQLSTTTPGTHIVSRNS